MSVIFLLTGISILVASGFLFAFIWAVRTGQFEDDYSPAVRILFDDENKKTTGDSTTAENHNQQPSEKN